MKMWKPALTILCCLFVVVSSYQPVMHGHKHYTKGTKKGVDLVTSSPVSQDCCNQRIKRIKAIRKFYDADAISSIDSIKQYYVSTRYAATAAPTAAAEQAATPTCNPSPYNLTKDKSLILYGGISRVWSQTVTLTPLGRRFARSIIRLITDQNPANSVAGITATIFINNFIPYFGQGPDACVIAQMINGSLLCSVDHNQTLLQGALTNLKEKYISVINPCLERTMALKTECDFRGTEYPPDPKVNQTVCYQNGFVYPIREIWENPRGGIAVGTLTPLAYEVYDSTDLKDKFLVACTTFALLEASQKVLDLWNRNYIAEGVDLVTSSPVSQDCCNQRIERIKAIRKFNDADAISSIDSIKQYYASTRCGATAVPTATPTAAATAARTP